MRSTRSLTLLAALCLSASALAPSAFAEEKRELGSHEHGAATLQVAIEGDGVEMALEVPGENIVGFEHAPETDEQKAAVEAERERLADPLALFVLPEDAGCEVASAEVELHQEGDHNAFEAEYELTCSNVGAIAAIETRLFEMYPTLEEIDVEFATAAGQGGGELEPDAASLALPAAS